MTDSHKKKSPGINPATSESSELYDVAIVGMGPAGLYTAWRLLMSKGQTVFGKPVEQLRVGLFDTMPETRVGGRLCTQPLPGYPFLAELGGMRFRSNQLLINGLIDSLKLRGQVKNFDFPQHSYFLREQVMTEKDFKSSSISNIYHLPKKERGFSPSQLIQTAIHQIIKRVSFQPHVCRDDTHKKILHKVKTKDGLGKLLPNEWTFIKRLGEFGKTADVLTGAGFWDLLQYQLSSGGWHLANDGLGYESIMGNWNAAIAIPWFINDFASEEFLTLENGMKSLPSELHKEIKGEKNCYFYYDWDLTGINLAKAAETSKSLVELKFNTKDEIRSVFAETVVLALPKGALIRLDYGKELIDEVDSAPDDLNKNSWFQDQLNSVEGKPLFKLFLGYKTPWWTETKFWKKNRAFGQSETGKVNTDTPLRQVYYYGKDQWNDNRKQLLGVNQKDRYSMLMASYSDSHYIEFWTEAGNPAAWEYSEKIDKAKIQRMPGDLEALETFGASRRMIVRAEHQLGLLHGKRDLLKRDIPAADIGLYMEWSRPPYYAGWHSWKVRVKPWEVCDIIRRPFGKTKVFICGEAYSTEQGWVEGALKSTERLLNEVFNLPLPPDMKNVFDSVNIDLKDYVDP